MNVAEKYQLILNQQREKGSREIILEVALEIIDELMKQDREISITELRILTDSLSIAYLATSDLKHMKENYEYVDLMIRYLTEYLEICQDDAILFDSCIFTLIAALYYEEAYDLCQRFYAGSGETKKVALKWLSSGLFLGDELMTKAERTAYKQEYSRYIS